MKSAASSGGGRSPLPLAIAWCGEPVTCCEGDTEQDFRGIHGGGKNNKSEPRPSGRTESSENMVVGWREAHWQDEEDQAEDQAGGGAAETRLSFCWHPLSIHIEAPTKWRGGCSRMTVSSGLIVEHLAGDSAKGLR